MNEIEKMTNGLIYDPFSKEIEKLRIKAHLLVEKYNKLSEIKTKKRNKILDKLLPNKGKSLYLQGPIRFNFGINIIFGDYCYANFNLTILDVSKVVIGNNVMIGPNVSLLTPMHPLSYLDRNQYYKDGKLTEQEYSKPIVIKDNCWIAGNVTVCGGVTIGEGSVIGAGSVVTRDIPPNSLAAGNPCRVIREITQKDRLENHPELFDK